MKNTGRSKRYAYVKNFSRLIARHFVSLEFTARRPETIRVDMERRIGQLTADARKLAASKRNLGTIGKSMDLAGLDDSLNMFFVRRFMHKTSAMSKEALKAIPEGERSIPRTIRFLKLLLRHSWLTDDFSADEIEVFRDPDLGRKWRETFSTIEWRKSLDQETCFECMGEDWSCKKMSLDECGIQSPVKKCQSLQLRKFYPIAIDSTTKKKAELENPNLIYMGQRLQERLFDELWFSQPPSGNKVEEEQKSIKSNILQYENETGIIINGRKYSEHIILQKESGSGSVIKEFGPCWLKIGAALFRLTEELSLMEVLRIAGPLKKSFSCELGEYIGSERLCDLHIPLRLSSYNISIESILGEDDEYVTRKELSDYFLSFHRSADLPGKIKAHFVEKYEKLFSRIISANAVETTANVATDFHSWLGFRDTSRAPRGKKNKKRNINKERVRFKIFIASSENGSNILNKLVDDFFACQRERCSKGPNEHVKGLLRTFRAPLQQSPAKETAPELCLKLVDWMFSSGFDPRALEYSQNVTKYHSALYEAAWKLEERFLHAVGQSMGFSETELSDDDHHHLEVILGDHQDHAVTLGDAVSTLKLVAGKSDVFAPEDVIREIRDRNGETKRPVLDAIMLRALSWGLGNAEYKKNEWVNVKKENKKSNKVLWSADNKNKIEKKFFDYHPFSFRLLGSFLSVNPAFLRNSLEYDLGEEIDTFSLERREKFDGSVATIGCRYEPDTDPDQMIVVEGFKKEDIPNQAEKRREWIRSKKQERIGNLVYSLSSLAKARESLEARLMFVEAFSDEKLLEANIEDDGAPFTEGFEDEHEVLSKNFDRSEGDAPEEEEGGHGADEKSDTAPQARGGDAKQGGPVFQAQRDGEWSHDQSTNPGDLGDFEPDIDDDGKRVESKPSSPVLDLYESELDIIDISHNVSSSLEDFLGLCAELFNIKYLATLYGKGSFCFDEILFFSAEILRSELMKIDPSFSRTRNHVRVWLPYNNWPEIENGFVDVFIRICTRIMVLHILLPEQQRDGFKEISNRCISSIHRNETETILFPAEQCLERLIGDEDMSRLDREDKLQKLLAVAANGLANDNEFREALSQAPYDRFSEETGWAMAAYTYLKWICWRDRTRALLDSKA